MLTVFFVNMLPFAAVVWAGAYLFFINRTTEDLLFINVERAAKYKSLVDFGSW